MKHLSVPSVSCCSLIQRPKSCDSQEKLFNRSTSVNYYHLKMTPSFTGAKHTYQWAETARIKQVRATLVKTKQIKNASTVPRVVSLHKNASFIYLLSWWSFLVSYFPFIGINVFEQTHISIHKAMSRFHLPSISVSLSGKYIRYIYHNKKIIHFHFDG